MSAIQDIEREKNKTIERLAAVRAELAECRQAALQTGVKNG